MLVKFSWMLRAILLKPFIGHFGFKSYLGPPIFISNIHKVFIGSRVRIYPKARIEVLGEGKITVEDNVSIGQSLHLISAKSVFIGRDTTISANVFISDVDHVYSDIDVHIMKQDLSLKDTRIGPNCFLGYGCVILPGTTLGKQNIVGANAVVKGDFPDYCVIVGSPARIVKRYNSATGFWDRTDSKGFFLE
jgi:acetyltransferase-like isoleucine patch superfamily enzyme